MPKEFLVEATKQKQKQEFKTEQLQETIQETMQQNGFQAEEIQQQIQKPSEKRVRKVKRHGIVDKTKNLFTDSEEVYGINQEEVTDNYAMERKDAFQQHLLEMCREHMNVNADSQFKKTISKIYEYARISSSRAKAAVKSEKLTQARSMIHRYIESKDGNAQLNENQNKALEIMKMYKLYFETFTDGNLVVPTGAYEKKAVDEEPELRKKHMSGILAAKYVDVSNRSLFPNEPSVEDIKQGGLGDCYLLAGLASVVMTDPMAIKRSMHDNGKTVTVRFYEPIMGTDGNEMGVRPVYITVNKTIVKDKYLMGETYAKSSLWVQMVEKAYAVWGYHVSGKTQERVDKEKQRIKEQLLSEGDTRTPDEVEKEAKQRALELVRGEKGSYEKIIGGNSSEFIKYFTGKEPESYMYGKAYTEKLLGSAIADNMTRAMGIETIKLLTVNNALSQKDQFQDALERFTVIGGKEMTEQLIKMNEEHGDASAAMIGGLGAVVANFHDVVIKRYVLAKQKNAGKKGNDERISLSEPIYLEDLQELLHEQMKKELFTKEGKLNYGLDEKYLPVIDTIIKHMLQMIPEEQDKVLTGSKEDGESAGIQFMYRTDSGKYSKYAEREYKKIVDALSQGYHVTMGMAGLVDGKRRGLNGENVTGGIVENHAYTVMGTQEMDGKKFIKLRNPWASTTQRYIRSTDKNQKETFYSERNESSSTDGIFLMELNDYLTRAAHTLINKDNVANVLHVKESVFQFDDLDEKETMMVNADSYYAKAKEEQIRHGLKNKAQEEARHPEMAKWNLTLEFYASAGYENYVAELVKYNLLMTESNPYYIMNKAKADNTFQKLKEKLCSFAKDASHQWLMGIAEGKINEELGKLRSSGRKSQKVLKRNEELNALLQLYKKISEQLEQKNENFSDEASNHLDALEHLLKGKQILDALQKEELEKAGLI